MGSFLSGHHIFPHFGHYVFAGIDTAGCTAAGSHSTGLNIAVYILAGDIAAGMNRTIYIVTVNVSTGIHGAIYFITVYTAACMDVSMDVFAVYGEVTMQIQGLSLPNDGDFLADIMMQKPLATPHQHNAQRIIFRNSILIFKCISSE